MNAATIGKPSGLSAVRKSPPSNAATVRRRNAAQPFDRAGSVRQSIRQAVANIGTRASRPACQRTPEAGDRAPVYPASRGEHRTRRRKRATVRQSPPSNTPPDSGQCRRILPAVCATVGRPPCFRGNRSRLARLISPETRRKRPPLRPPPVPCPRPSEMCRALCKAFSTVCNAGKPSATIERRKRASRGEHRTPPPSASRPAVRPLAGSSSRPVSGSTVATYPARQAAPPVSKRRNAGKDSGDRVPPVSLSARIPATVRPSAPVSGQPLAVLTWNAGKPKRGRPFDRAGSVRASLSGKPRRRKRPRRIRRQSHIFRAILA